MSFSLTASISAVSHGRQAVISRMLVFFVDAALAARLPFKVLHGIGDVGCLAADAGFFHARVEQAASGTDEG